MFSSIKKTTIQALVIISILTSYIQAKNKEFSPEISSLDSSSMQCMNLKFTKRGIKFYRKKLRRSCGFTGQKLASMHTGEEWEEILQENGISNEIQKICPKIKEKTLKKIEDKYNNDIFQMVHCYADGSGNYAPC